jgi:Kef-type K+ transport system membrane component KefB
MGHFEFQSLGALGILLLCGYFGGRLANTLKLPRVTGYIIAGLLLSPSVSGIISEELVQEKLSIVTDIGLAIIAFSVGGSLSLARLKQLGKSILWINVTESLGAFILTFILVFLLSPLVLKLNTAHSPFFGVYLPFALIIGAVSAATAPAAILAIVHEYKAQGPLTTTLLGVVALDDGMAIIFFAFATAIVSALTKAEISVYKMIVDPTLVIMGSIFLGAIFGLFLTGLAAWVKGKESLLVIIFGHILLCAGIAKQFNLSPLMAIMMIGFIVVNRAKHSHDLFLAVENIEETIFALFFTLAGAHFDIAVIKLAGFMALIITFSRFGGKLLGTKLGANFSHAPDKIRKYLGFALLPTAGVAIGLILMAKPHMEPQLSTIMINAILGAVIINELIAPPFVKFALMRAGEGVME